MVYNMFLHILKAVETDVDTIVRISNAGGPEGKPRQELPAVLPQGYMDAFATIDADPSQLLMVAETDGAVAGSFHLSFLTHLSGCGQPDAQIEDVHVSEKFREQGIGKQMLALAMWEARNRNSRRMQLTSDKRRLAAHAFYERLGFRLSHVGMKCEL